ncbi:hypothetical protein IAR55_004409 [Kwoniella newhampshirensis]|uniref:Uncharacterized protein n=1 Tax=Kwoniella newhampshirensis TaxID=1651941 RepID=A0AAW0YK82_9TREE
MAAPLPPPPQQRMGRQSLPPMSSSRQLSSPRISSIGLTLNTGNIGGGPSSSSFTATTIHMPTSRSLGNLRGSSEGAAPGAGGGSGGGGGGASTTRGSTMSPSANLENLHEGVGGSSSSSRPKKKKTKKGMKGWAWVVQDEDGNTYDVPDEEETVVPLAASTSGTTSASVIKAENQPQVGGTERRTSGTGGGSSLPRSRASTVAHDDHPIPSTSATNAIPTPTSPSANVSASGTVSTAIAMTKRMHKSSSPDGSPPADGEEAVVRDPSPPVENGRTSKTPNSPKSTGTTETVAPRNQPPKKRRKTSLPPTITTARPPPLERSSSAHVARTATVTPGTATATATSSKTKVSSSHRHPYSASTAAIPPTRSNRAALIVRSANETSRAGSQHVVDDDNPLPAPPRVGMGEGGYDPPKESAIREEALLRREAKYIIDAAEANRRELEIRARSQIGGTDLGKRVRRPVNYHHGGETDHYGSNGIDYTDPSSGPSSSRRDRNRNDTSAHRQDSFEAQFALIQSSYKAMETARRGRDGGNSHLIEWSEDGGNPLGADGLTVLMERDAQGFIDNVKENLKEMIKFYCSGDDATREAYCERIGRGLQQLGWELTDNSDAALLP